MADSFEKLMWEHILSNEPSNIGEHIVDGVPQNFFYSPRFARLFWRMFEAGSSWKWGLVELDFFDDMLITHMREGYVRFRPRIDHVRVSDFNTYGLELMYQEIGDMYLDTSTDADSY